MSKIHYQTLLLQAKSWLFAIFCLALVILIVATAWDPIWEEPCSPWYCVGNIRSAALSLVLMLGLFLPLWWFIDQSSREKLPNDKVVSRSSSAFPHEGTGPLAVVLLIGLCAFLWALLSVLFPAEESAESWFNLNLTDSDFHEPAVAFLAAGIGSTIATIYAYLRHACTYQDFDRAFIPWYFLRPVLGSLLGLVFYWLLRGGILAVLPAQESGELKDLNLNGIAGISALVGLFSRQAIEKLREIFHVIFVTQGKVPTQVKEKVLNEFVSKLPNDLRKSVQDQLR